MNHRVYPICIAGLFWLAGCIKQEALNMEADIIEVKMPDSVLITPPSISNNTVTAFVNFEKLDITAFAPGFTLTPGAKITPAPGTPQNFTAPVTYTVESEDGVWRKEYKISLIQNTVSDTFNFENWALDPVNNYHTAYEVVFSEDQEVWASGNSGYAIIASEKVPTAYPTQRTTDAVEGVYAAYLETKSTGALGAIFGMPIAPGNLFLGSFDGSKALASPLEATVFGVPFNKKPIRFTGSYKYTSGGSVSDKNGNVVSPRRDDTCDIYAVLFKTTSDKPNLNGTNVLTDPNVVAIAQLPSGASTSGSGYHSFSIPFEYKSEINDHDLASYGYKLVIVFSSSKNGSIFEGSVGSKLSVDAVRIVTE